MMMMMMMNIGHVTLQVAAAECVSGRAAAVSTALTAARHESTGHHQPAQHHFTLHSRQLFKQRSHYSSNLV